MSKSTDITNRKASFEYAFLMEFEAGIMLTGSEIKSLREGKVNLGDAYCFLTNGELFVKNMHIAGYKFATYNDHDPLRLRKLLLNKSELRKIESKLKDKGLTVIPFRIYINEKGKAKLMIAVAKGKKTFDKRESIKERETGRRIREGKGDE